MADEPRAVQSLERLKISANKFMARIKADSSDTRASELLQEKLRDIELVQLEAAAAEVKEKQKKGGVNIKVPVHDFSVKPRTPVTPE